VSTICFLLSIGLVVIGRWVKSASFCRVIRAVVFHQAAAVLPFTCSSLWSATPPAKLGNLFWMLPSVQISALGSTSCPALGGWPVALSLLSAFVLSLISAEFWWLFWEVGFLPHSLFQPLCLSWCLLGTGGSSGRLVCYPVPTLSLCCFTHVSLKVQLLAPPLFSGAGSAFHPHLHCWYEITIHYLCFPVLLWGVQSAQGLCSRTVTYGVPCSPVPSGVSHRQLWSQLVGRNGSMT
jgi:hypothetical protein